MSKSYSMYGSHEGYSDDGLPTDGEYYIGNENFKVSRPMGGKGGHYSLNELHALNPIVFVRSPYGDFFRCRDDWLYRQRWAEPIVYLYSPQKTQFRITLSEKIGLELLRPKIKDRSWDVTTLEDGQLFSHLTGEKVPYLFWEGRVERGRPPIEGFLIEGWKTRDFFAQKLRFLGLSSREIKDFLKFWSDYSGSSPYFFIHFLPLEEIDRRAPIEISPLPDTRIRVSMFISPKSEFEEVPIQELTPGPIRKGNVFVEWGVVGF